MKSWLVVKSFILGEASTNLRGLSGNEGEFNLSIGTTILQSEVSDKVIINDREYHFQIGTSFEKFCSLKEVISESITASVLDGIVNGEAVGFKWVNPDEIVEVVPNKVFRLPDRFEPESLAVMVRGLMVARDNEDGFEIIDDMTFMLKEPINTGSGDWLMAGYVKTS